MGEETSPRYAEGEEEFEENEEPCVEECECDEDDLQTCSCRSSDRCSCSTIHEPIYGKGGAAYVRHGGFSLNTQNYPNAVNHVRISVKRF